MNPACLNTTDLSSLRDPQQGPLVRTPEVRRGKAEVLVCLVCGPVRADPVWGFWQTPNPTAAEFVPMNSLLGPGHLTHSTSTPSFSQFSGNPNLTAGGTSFGRLAPDTPLGLGLGKVESPGLSPDGSPLESLGGTTYFYHHDEANSSTEEGQPVMVPEYQVYPGNPAHDILHRQSLTLGQRNPEANPDLPTEVDTYHNLCLLEASPTNGPPKSNTFGFVTSVYKATNIKNGIYYCLRRVHAIVFVYDYHPGADTLMNQYFSQSAGAAPALNGFCPPMYPQTANGLTRPFPHGKSGLGSLRQHAGLLPESLIWAFVVQLSSVLRTIHAAGLACRSFEPSKILVMGKSRLRLNCCGIMDVLTFDASVPNSKALVPHYQQEDLVSLGKLVLALACNTMAAIQRENLQQSMELVSRNYSADLRNLILYLLSSPPRTHSINDIMPMIGARFYTQLDAAQMRSDVIENELAKEVENGRLFRMLIKLGTISERPEFHLDSSWSETGDRYMLKLFRDYLFHQVTKDSRPWIDVAHVVQALNKVHGSHPSCLRFEGLD
ncbi:PAB-dependent poly(A)-specific ribonuclease subunit PAN3, putative [Ixodes scapularis]|uniref:PAB-dependent poly(A)-specific ribonuclease subunit PAN3, putative n=1 Tax=Ixodes scapularis TaxID=6945 RepID=B7Q0Q0_IXOSC|nr:PAB-dependent poly(A)-specific ribonuclease subunit PAN3, putative [Ixodes scapularis]|eukprot:XP_002408091.1 PAB-dependent poly(A)-specific ribonuclease subunit PAN3, putative [Ixodes scapularis]